MKEKLLFFKKYLSQSRYIGALLPSSRYLAKAVSKHLELDQAKVVVELGAGTGVLTQELIRSIPQNCDLVIVERDNDFAHLLKNKFNGSHVWATEAENMHHYLDEHNFKQVDCFVSGLPFISLPKEVGKNILSIVRQYLKPGGVFISYSYFANSYFLFKKYFPKVKIDFVFRNIPPAYVFICRNDVNKVAVKSGEAEGADETNSQKVLNPS